MKIVIFTNSLSACKVLDNEKSINNYVTRILNIYDNSNIEKFQLVSTPSHSGIYFNEETDEIAKRATEVGTVLEFEYTASGRKTATAAALISLSTMLYLLELCS